MLELKQMHWHYTVYFLHFMERMMWLIIIQAQSMSSRRCFGIKVWLFCQRGNPSPMSILAAFIIPACIMDCNSAQSLALMRYLYGSDSTYYPTTQKFLVSI